MPSFCVRAVELRFGNEDFLREARKEGRKEGRCCWEMGPGVGDSDWACDGAVGDCMLILFGLFCFVLFFCVGRVEKGKK